MILKVGKHMIEATCPLCSTIYILDMNEFTETKDYITFQCPECNRLVNSSRDLTHPIKRMLKEPIEFNDSLFYS